MVRGAGPGLPRVVRVRARVSVEAGIAQGWWKYLRTDGRAVSLEHFGASADAVTLFREFAEAVAAAARESIRTDDTVSGDEHSEPV